MDVRQLKREIDIHTRELQMDKLDLVRAKEKVRDLESNIRENERLVENFKHDLYSAESAEKNKQQGKAA